MEQYGITREKVVNILSLAKVQEKYHVTYYYQDGNAFLVVNPYGQAHSFRMSERWLYTRYAARQEKLFEVHHTLLTQYGLSRGLR